MGSPVSIDFWAANPRTIESIHKVQEDRIDRLEKNMEDLLKDWKKEDLNEYWTGY